MIKIPFLKLLIKSFIQTKNNSILILPTIIQIGILLGIIIVYHFQLILFYLINGSTRLSTLFIPTSVVNWFIAGIFLVLDILIILSGIAYTIGMRIGLMKELTTNGVISKKIMFNSGKKYFSVLIKFVSLLGPFYLFYFIFINYMISDIRWNMILYYVPYYGSSLGIMITRIIIEFLFIIFILELFLLFFAPILSKIQNTSKLFLIMKKSIQFAYKHPFITVLAWLIVLIMSDGLEYISKIIFQIGDDPNFIYIISIGILLFIIDICMKLFIFQVYFKHQELIEKEVAS